MDAIGIGLVGYGMIGRVHTLAYRELPLFYPRQLPPLHLAMICTSRTESARAAAEEAGFDAWGTEVASLVRRDDVNVVDCSSPNYLHYTQVMEAIAAGKHVYCEKPLALNVAEARQLLQSARQAGVQVGMTFNYRFVPAVQRARQLIQAGMLGQIYSFRADYLHTGYQDPNRPMGWKLRREQAGGGALVDLGSHLIDMIRFLLGDFEAVRAAARTFITERPVSRGSTQKEPVTVDDVAWVQARLRDGVTGTLEVSRFATGMVDDLRFEIHGERGACKFNLLDPNWLYWYDATRTSEPMGGERGWTRLETMQHYPGAAVPPSRATLGWARTHAENQYAFLRAVVEGRRPQPDIQDGLQVQLVLDAAYASIETGAWASVSPE
jgi:levoglucosan dehydrogenase